MKPFSIVGPTMWNELLTDELRECTSVDVFKKRLKTHLFQSSLLIVIPFSHTISRVLILLVYQHVYFHCYSISVSTLY